MRGNHEREEDSGGARNLKIEAGKLACVDGQDPDAYLRAWQRRVGAVDGTEVTVLRCVDFERLMRELEFWRSSAHSA